MEGYTIQAPIKFYVNRFFDNTNNDVKNLVLDKAINLKFEEPERDDISIVIKAFKVLVDEKILH